MSSSNQINRAVRRALVVGAVVTAASLPAVAQVAAEQPIETITITGSRIPQPNLEAISPVTAVTSDQIKLAGTTRVEDLLNTLPQVMADFGANLSNGATGAATVNLRGLGAQRTLVLVNGRRLMPGAGARANSPPARCRAGCAALDFLPVTRRPSSLQALSGVSEPP